NAGVQTLSLRAHIQAPRLVIKTSPLDFGVALRGGVREARLVIANEGSAPLEAHLQPQAPWLSLSEQYIACRPGEQVALTVAANTELFEHGEQLDLPAGIRVVAGSAVYDVPVRIGVLQPVLSIEPERIDFGYVDQAEPERRTLVLTNAGSGDLAWNAQADAIWVEIAPTSGVCKSGEAQLLELTAYGLAVETPERGATSEANLVINSDGGRAKVPLRVGLAAPLLAIDTPAVALVSVNGAEAHTTLRIFNHGLGLLRGTIATSQTWLALDRASFTCPTGRSVELRLSADMEELPHNTEHAESLVAIASNGGDLEIEVSLSLERTPWVEAPSEIALERATPEGPPQGRLVLRNVGLANAHLELRASPGLTLARRVCDIKPQKSTRIAVTAASDQAALDEVQYIVIQAGDQELRVDIHIPD
ncbi:MAG: hypothetical protein JXA74_04810, partial [Anaerolineae bacterium]|nr:hypothetical protein [Anaerolineae bacterium]